MTTDSRPTSDWVNPTQVRAMFGRIAQRYDRANTVLSMGVHHWWRRAAVEASGVGRGGRVLDCATGTGDLALAFKKAVGVHGEVVGTDFCEEMLVHARRKAQAKSLSVVFETADVTALPYPDAYFDVTSISFGIRNVRDPIAGLAEMRRVTKPGGSVVVLEFGERQIPVWSTVFSAFSRYVIPSVGGWISGDRGAYEYLHKTSGRFPCGDAFLDWMKKTGPFSSLRSRALTGGIAYLYIGRLPG